MSGKKINKPTPIHPLTKILGIIVCSVLFIMGMKFITEINFTPEPIQTLQKPQGINKWLVKNTPSIPNKNTIAKELVRDKTNILIVGRGGEGHDAPELTDTIILASINTKTKTISMLSIPRDLYVTYQNGGSGRINKIYEITKEKHNSKKIAMEAIKNKVQQLTGEKIHFFVNIDFNAFKKAIDIIGGIELTLTQPFIDNKFPDGKGGYKKIVFRKGTWMFDGENALKYARSRHSTSDFDRSLRQQQIINSIRKKLSASSLITSPGTITKLYQTFNQYVYNNLNLKELISLGMQIKGANYTVRSFTLNDSCFYGSDNCNPGGLLYVPNREYFGGASVLLVGGQTKGDLDNYKNIHKYTNIIFNQANFFKENYQIKVYNSLPINGLASTLAGAVRKYGFRVPNINGVGNTKKVYEKSVIYYNNIKDSSHTIQILRDFFPKIKFQEVQKPIYSNTTNTKIEIIIGQDYSSIFSGYLTLLESVE